MHLIEGQDSMQMNILSLTEILKKTFGLIPVRSQKTHGKKLKRERKLAPIKIKMLEWTQKELLHIRFPARPLQMSTQ